MTFTSDERREVAERLRMFARDVNGTRDFRMYLSHWVGIDDVTDDEGKHFSVAADRRCAERTLEKLADLIDRPTCRDTEARVDSFTCSSCGFSEGKIMFNPFTYSFRTIKPNWKYCPNCGAEVVEKGEDDV